VLRVEGPWHNSHYGNHEEKERLMRRIRITGGGMFWACAIALVFLVAACGQGPSEVPSDKGAAKETPKAIPESVKKLKEDAEKAVETGKKAVTEAAEKVKEGAEKILKTGEKATQEAGEKLKELDKKSQEPAKEKAAPSK
jgi:predicted small lipoprotein YifL